MKTKFFVPDFENKKKWLTRYTLGQHLKINAVSVRKLVEVDDFPRPIVWNKRPFWRREEVEAWVVKNWLSGN